MLTPRLYDTEIAGALLRIERERALTWFGAMLPHLKKPPTLQEFTGKPVDRREELRQCIEAWDEVDRALKGNRK